jgi:hypothetical protein
MSSKKSTKSKISSEKLSESLKRNAQKATVSSIPRKKNPLDIVDDTLDQVWALAVFPVTILSKVLSLVIKTLKISGTAAFYYLICVSIYRAPYVGVPDPNGGSLANLGLLGFNPFITHTQIQKAWNDIQIDFKYHGTLDKSIPYIHAKHAYKSLIKKTPAEIAKLWVLENLNFIEKIDAMELEIEETTGIKVEKKKKKKYPNGYDPVIDKYFAESGPQKVTVLRRNK